MGFIKDVLAFHKKFNHHTPDNFTIDNFPEVLRVKLIVEEALEFAEACGYRVEFAEKGPSRFEIEKFAGLNIEKAVDACLDLIYVTVGTLLAFGLTKKQIMWLWAEVQRANMSKSMKKDEKSTPGKTLKPANFVPAKIGEILTIIAPQYEYGNTRYDHV